MKVTDKITITNEDNMELMARYPDKYFELKNFINNTFRIIKYIAAPYSNNSNPAFFKVFILRGIECNSLFLTMVKSFVNFRVTVPIIPIKLNYCIYRWYKCINTKFIEKKFLWFKFNIVFLKNIIANSFNFSRCFRLLNSIHFNQTFKYRFTIISAFYRAESPARNKAGRNHKVFFTYLTLHCYFFVLPFFLAIRRTAYSFISTVFRHIKRLTTYNTCNIFTCFFPARFTVFMVTMGRAIFHSFNTGFYNFHTTSNTSVFSYSVFHTVNIHNLIQKPVALYKWLLDKYAKQGDKILDTHLGSGSIAIACHDYGFDLTACELDPDYYESAIKRIKNHVSQQKLF